MLLEAEKSIKEIIIECGFENQSYFFRLFKKTVGVTPSVYAQRNMYYGLTNIL